VFSPNPHCFFGSWDGLEWHACIRGNAEDVQPAAALYLAMISAPSFRFGLWNGRLFSQLWWSLLLGFHVGVAIALQSWWYCSQRRWHLMIPHHWELCNKWYCSWSSISWSPAILLSTNFWVFLSVFTYLLRVATIDNSAVVVWKQKPFCYHTIQFVFSVLFKYHL
jgi:hypothetical protein